MLFCYPMNQSLSQIFSKIYAKESWGNGSASMPLSGVGSNPDSARVYVEFVRKVILDFQIRSVVDLGHGDWSMWRDYKFENTKYYGFDVVEKIVDINTRNFGNEARTFTLLGDGDLLPAADLFICKDVLQHLSLKDIDSILIQIKKYKFIILCNDYFSPMSVLKRLRLEFKLKFRIKMILKLSPKVFQFGFSRNNAEISSGEWRGIDLESEMFSTHFSEFDIEHRIDYDKNSKSGFHKRIILFSNADKNRKRW